MLIRPAAITPLRDGWPRHCRPPVFSAKSPFSHTPNCATSPIGFSYVTAGGCHLIKSYVILSNLLKIHAQAHAIHSPDRQRRLALSFSLACACSRSHRIRAAALVMLVCESCAQVTQKMSASWQPIRLPACAHPTLLTLVSSAEDLSAQKYLCKRRGER